ncbi:WAS/WASL-interacting protein family member 1 [Acyrthosiphon pisum]|uniref:Uncharacterized protein n=1 Tax=Acyrthosiphon pisum TaxID=7029 RepID=A0A8R1W8F3_ACYPI|nr:WAS/WASL-interacting protein family member 1 [Acyrthosiphon pisum]|eukprot:XP_003244656.1 PREDICTED: WAS/WASL-interacting protein family member 1 [Acyrthosiphon pisum]
MHFKVTIAAWLLAILFISQTKCDDKDDKHDKNEKKANDGHGSSGSGGNSGSSGGSGNSGSSGGSGSSGSSGGGSGSSGSKPTGTDNMTFGMNGMSGIQLPFPFFPPFGCDTTCQPIQLQIFQPQVPRETVPTTHAPTTHAPTTMPPPPKTTMPAPKPAPTTPTYTSQTIIMYPNWCQGWCKFFYQPPPQPVYYQPNCLLFSWMGLGSGMAMGMQPAQS